MKTLTFTDNDQVRVSYKTDLISETQQNFTVMEVFGLDTIEEKKQFLFQQLPSNLPAFRKFAEDNELELVMDDNHSLETLVTTTTTEQITTTTTII